MGASLLDGKKISSLIKDAVRKDIDERLSRNLRNPRLQVIIVGDNPASETYVAQKTRSCAEVGIISGTTKLPDTVSEQELKNEIRKLNEDPSVDGILVQLPLPSHLHPLSVIETIDYRKDVDGFHPMNVGRLQIGQPCFQPCTPAGILEMLTYYSIPTKGKHAVVVGASNIVGSPMAVMLSRESTNFGKATTTICHKYTRDITRHTIDADILIVAAGSPNLITGNMVKEGVVVVDVGMNRIGDLSQVRGYRLVGDCDYASVSEKASWITPVPGGVGPMTVAMLMRNTLLAAKQSIYKN
jgi:methylenetetrahydrofolate dehydrogenase (NADP+)/methenyltetrahydrofolate cyclohydrolase